MKAVAKKPSARTISSDAGKASTNGATGHLIGYARVSSVCQGTATQVEKLETAGCTLVRTEKVSGKSREVRGELASILDFIRPGDALVVVKLDRLGRSTRDVLNLVHELEEKEASLRVLEPAIDTGGPMGRMVLGARYGRGDGVGLHQRSPTGRYRGRQGQGRLQV
jgi:Resolvase, N terminal domain